MTPLLAIRNLRVTFATFSGDVTAVDGVSLEMAPGETLGIVGESGSGKSVLSLAVMRLTADPPTCRIEGDITFEGEDLRGKSEREMQAIRGNRIAMIFQEPMTALNPVYTVGRQIGEAILAHQKVTEAAARARVVELLRLVRIPAAETRVDAYPHELSGGMRQRVMIAMALASRPSLIIADEPTTALDVTVQAQILHLLRDIRQSTGAGVVLITHDLGVVAEMADRVAVMYAGRVVETARVRALFEDAMHPYTIGLLCSIPELGTAAERLSAIPGTVPSPGNMPVGCRFHPRCPFAVARCEEEPPPLREIAAGHLAACWRLPIEDVETV
ncbi:ABC transporter ATP-binding protein [Stella sp.]|uniref:ABC transporter ATP-binding protein n=1 Tax=Stella sp. TaxID=2912054 RepID=UPI0035AF7AFD